MKKRKWSLAKLCARARPGLVLDFGAAANGFLLVSRRLPAAGAKAGGGCLALGWVLMALILPLRLAAQVDYVDPGIGSIAHLLEPTRPTVSLPYGVVRMYPVRRDGTDDQIQFFPLAIISHRLGELFSVVPCGNQPQAQKWYRPVSYDQETLTPYFYSARLEDSAIRIEFTPMARCGIFRFTFPQGKPVLLLGNRHEGELRPSGTNAFAGIENFNNMRAFVYGEFSVPVELTVTNAAGKNYLTVVALPGSAPPPARTPSIPLSESQATDGQTDFSMENPKRAVGPSAFPAGQQTETPVARPKGAGTVEKGSFLLRIFGKRHRDEGETRTTIVPGSDTNGAKNPNLPPAGPSSTAPAQPQPVLPGNVVELRYGISFVSLEQAQRNLTEEMPGWDFENIKAQGRAKWNQALGQIQVEGGTLSQRRLFYSALYRCCERMVNITENSQYYSGFDHQVHADARPFYTDNGLWDTYRALEPLQTLLNPEMQSDKLQSYVRMFEQSGWMPGFAVIWGNYPCMIGNHAAAWMADSWFKGVRGFDLKTAYEGLRKNAIEGTLLPWRIGPKCALDDFYSAHGYFPALRPGEPETEALVNPFERRQAVSVTLEQSYDDWCTAQLARALSLRDDYGYFLKRAGNYKSLYRQEEGFMWPRDGAGNWIEPFDPQFSGGRGGRDYTTENNIYIYNWDVQHDYAGLAALMGGNRAAETKLDQLFRTDLGRSKYEFFAAFPDSTGLIGQFTIGNQPGMVIPYLYNHFGAPWKTQKRIRQVLDCWFADTPLGFPGNEDEGAMSAFVVFSMMGFYPVVPGLPVYELGSPVFDKVTIRLHNGNALRIVSRHNSAENKYVQSLTMNGQAQDHVWFKHRDVLKGLTIELEMGNTPNKQLGSEQNTLPPSSMDLDPTTLE